MLPYSSSLMTLHHIEVVSLTSNLSVASVVSAKSFETGSKCYPNAKRPARQGVLLCIIGIVNRCRLWLRVFGILTGL